MGRGKRILAMAIGLMATACVINAGVVDSWPPVTMGMVPTGSMSPYIEPGDIIYIDRAILFQDIGVGDVVVYWADGNMIVHRVVGFEGMKLVTQGDANSFPDSPVAAEQYVGVVSGLHEIHILNKLFPLLPMESMLVFPNNVLLILNIGLCCTLIVLIPALRKRRLGRHAH